MIFRKFSTRLGSSATIAMIIFSPRVRAAKNVIIPVIWAERLFTR